MKNIINIIYLLLLALLSENIMAQPGNIILNGNVGIQTSPVTDLHVAGNGTFRVGRLSNEGGQIQIFGGSIVSPQMRFFDEGNEKARIGVPTGSDIFQISAVPSISNQFVVHTNGNVGIGTSNPAADLHVAGLGELRVGALSNQRGQLKIYGGDVVSPQIRIFDGGTEKARIGVSTGTNALRLNAKPTLSNQFVIQSDGNIGIGIGNPGRQLHLWSADDPTILLQSNGNAEPSGRVSMRQSDNTGFDVFFDGAADRLVFEGFSAGSSQGRHMEIEFSTGNVAIGTSNLASGYKLSVDGKVAAEELLVDLSGSWPDYVFNDSYDLPTLSEVKSHIEKKGHLPGIPSAQEIEDNGFEVGEMNRILVEKVEELTLYILDQQERLCEQQEQLDAHKTLLDQLIQEESK